MRRRWRWRFSYPRAFAAEYFIISGIFHGNPCNLCSTMPSLCISVYVVMYRRTFHLNELRRFPLLIGWEVYSFITLSYITRTCMFETASDHHICCSEHDDNCSESRANQHTCNASTGALPCENYLRGSNFGDVQGFIASSFVWWTCMATSWGYLRPRMLDFVPLRVRSQQTNKTFCFCTHRRTDSDSLLDRRQAWDHDAYTR